LFLRERNDEPSSTCWLGEFENSLATDIIFDENSIRNSLKTSLSQDRGK
jgi:hypothetical protein